MENEAQTTYAAFSDLFDGLLKALNNLFLPSRYSQVVILIACVAAAWAIHRWVGPRTHDWLRDREGWPKWRLRTALIVHKRLRLIIFVLLAWGAAAVLAYLFHFPSRRYLVTLGATIATAVLMVSFAARFISNPLLRPIVTWGLWAYVTIYYLGLSEEVSGFLDRVAIQFGSFHVSALSVIKALVVTGVLVTLARFVTQSSTRRIRGNKDISPSMQELAVKGLQIGLYGAAFFIGLKAVGFDLTGLAVLSVIIWSPKSTRSTSASPSPVYVS